MCPDHRLLGGAGFSTIGHPVPPQRHDLSCTALASWHPGPDTLPCPMARLHGNYLSAEAPAQLQGASESQGTTWLFHAKPLMVLYLLSHQVQLCSPLHPEVWALLQPRPHLCAPGPGPPFPAGSLLVPPARPHTLSPCFQTPCGLNLHLLLIPKTHTIH